MPINRALGWKPERPDYRDYKYETTRLKVEAQYKLPPKVDLRANMPKVYDQKNLSSCVACSTTALVEYDRKKQGLTLFQPSILFVYYNARLLDGMPEIDDGTYLRSGIKSVVKYGYSHSELWPYDEDKVCVKPSVAAYDDAKNLKALSYYRLNNSDINSLKHCLAAGFPFIFGSTLYENFFEADTNGGKIPMPNGKEVGGHAMCCVGYNDETGYFLIRNSWGENLGENGYYRMPYSYMTNLDLTDDLWTIRRVS